MDICDTPVSPELLPPDSHGKIQQKTEEVLGSYDLHDFFLYHMLRHHEEPKKIFDLAKLAFQSVDSNVILKAIQTFYSRFFTQQFKRNCFLLEVIGECLAMHLEIFGLNKLTN